MLVTGLHTLCGNFPYALRQVDLVPARAADLAAAACREDQELQAAGVYSAVLPQLPHERADLAPGQRRMMLNTLHLAALWQHLVEMPPPVPGSRRRATCALLHSRAR